MGKTFENFGLKIALQVSLVPPTLMKKEWANEPLTRAAWNPSRIGLVTSMRMLLNVDPSLYVMMSSAQLTWVGSDPSSGQKSS